MKSVLLDTNFILTCIKEKIDLFHDIKMKGIEILIPSQVIREIEKISKTNKKFSKDAEVALKLLKVNKFKKIDLEESYVDKGIKRFADKNKEIIIATLDRELKVKLKNKLITIRRKRIEIVSFL